MRLSSASLTSVAAAQRNPDSGLPELLFTFGQISNDSNPRRTTFAHRLSGSMLIEIWGWNRAASFFSSTFLATYHPPPHLQPPPPKTEHQMSGGRRRRKECSERRVNVVEKGGRKRNKSQAEPLTFYRQKSHCLTGYYHSAHRKIDVINIINTRCKLFE